MAAPLECTVDSQDEELRRMLAAIPTLLGLVVVMVPASAHVNLKAPPQP